MWGLVKRLFLLVLVGVCRFAFEGVDVGVYILIYYCEFEGRDFSHNLFKGLKGTMLSCLLKY